jgi:hypothetical protein
MHILCMIKSTWRYVYLRKSTGQHWGLLTYRMLMPISSQMYLVDSVTTCLSRSILKWKSADQYLSALKKQILISYPTTLPIFIVFHSTLRLKLERLYDQRADKDEVDLIHHNEPLTKKVLKRLCEYSYVNGDFHSKMYMQHRFSFHRPHCGDY